MTRLRFPARPMASVAVLLVAVAVAVPSQVAADFFDDVGYTQLLAELGDAIPTGSGIGVNHTEATSPPGTGPYAPNPSDPELAGKAFYEMSGPRAEYSTHATSMAKTFYGINTSTAPDVDEIDVWEAEDYLASGFLRNNTVQAPAVEPRSVQNHSWIGGYADESSSIRALRRLDYAIDRDGFVAVVGVNNGATNPLPALLGQSYNSISVGRSDGNHSHGLTTLDGPGRVKPEIVAPSVNTSAATTRVSSAAAMLLQRSAELEGAGSAGASAPQVVKAILLAGATKDEFADRSDPWDHSEEQPLDDVFGAGELNVYRSYHILDADLQPASDSSLVGALGWDFSQTLAEGKTYFFEVPTGYRLREFSALLTWHRKVTAMGYNPQSSLENLDLLLHAAAGFTLGEPLHASLSTVDNLEHIYLNGPLGLAESLTPGRYALDVVAPVFDGPVRYGLAWFGDLILMGDVNLDGAVNGLDINPFVDTLVAGPYVDTADMNQDGAVNGLDVELFAEAVVSTAGLAAVQSIPEPSTLVLACLGLVAIIFSQSPSTRRRAGDGGRFRHGGPPQHAH